MSPGPTLTVMRRERRHRRDAGSTGNVSGAFERSSPHVAGMPLYLRSLSGTGLVAEPETDDDIDLADDSNESETEGIQVSDATTSTPAAESQSSPPSGGGGGGNSGAGEEPPDAREQSARIRAADAVEAPGDLVRESQTTAQVTSAEAATASAPPPVQPSAQPALPTQSELDREQRVTAPGEPAAVREMPAADAALESSEAELARSHEATEGTPTAAPEHSEPVAHEGGESPAAETPSVAAASTATTRDSSASGETTDTEPTEESAAPDGAGGPASVRSDQRSAEGTADAEEVSSAASPELASATSDLLTSPDIPLAGDATAQLAEIDADCDQSAEAVQAEAAAKRQGIRDYFGEKRSLVSEFLAGSGLAVVGFLDLKRATLTASLMTKVMTVQTFALSLVNSAVALGVRFSNAIRQGVSAVTSILVNGIDAVITGALDIAESIPIPDLPGIGRIRNAILRIARQATSRLRTALNNVQSFIEAAVAAAIGAVQSLMANVAATILRIFTNFLSMVMRAIAGISGQLAAIARQIRALIQAIGRGVNRTLSAMERGAVQQITRSEADALREIERNREAGRSSVTQILEFCYASGDFPPEEASHPHLDAVDEASVKEDFETAALAAMTEVSTKVRERNGGIIRDFTEWTSSLAAQVFAAAIACFTELLARTAQAFLDVMTRVTQAAADLLRSIAGVAAEILGALGALITNVIAALQSVVTAIVEVVRVPVDALMNIGRTIIGRVRSFFNSIISRLVSLFSSDSEGHGDSSNEASSLTGDLNPFEVSRLKAAARMASPPLAAAAILLVVAEAVAAAAAAVAASIMTILFWVGVVLLVIALLVLIYLLIQRAMAKPRAVPRAPPRAKPKTKSRRRRRRKPKTPLKWNPSLSMGVVTASGGMPGTLDTTSKLPASAPLHGHHVWPKYVGGPIVQPLMSIRDTVHITIVHPGLHAVMKAAAISMGQDITTNTSDPRNLAFVAHLRSNLGDRSAFSAVMTAFYTGLNAKTSPPIPVPAFGRGIAHSFPRI